MSYLPPNHNRLLDLERHLRGQQPAARSSRPQPQRSVTQRPAAQPKRPRPAPTAAAALQIQRRSPQVTALDDHSSQQRQPSPTRQAGPTPHNPALQPPQRGQPSGSYRHLAAKLGKSYRPAPSQTRPLSMPPKPTAPEVAQAFTAPDSNPAPQAIAPPTPPAAPPAAPPSAPPRSRNGRAKPTRPSRPAPKTSWKTLALTIRQARLGLNPEPLLPEASDLELDQPLSKQRQDAPSHGDNGQRVTGEPQTDGGETRSIAGDIQRNASKTQPVMAEMQPVTDDIQIAIDDIQSDTSDTQTLTDGIQSDTSDTQTLTNDTQTFTNDIQSDTDDTRHDRDDIQIVIDDTQPVTEDTQPPVSGTDSDTDKARADTRDALAVDVEVLPPDPDTPINVVPSNTVTQPATVKDLSAIRPKRETTSFASGLLLLVYQLACPPQIIESLSRAKRHKPKKTSAKHRR